MNRLFLLFLTSLMISGCSISPQLNEDKAVAIELINDQQNCASVLEDLSAKQCSHRDVIEHLLKKSMEPGQRAVPLSPEMLIFEDPFSVDMRLINNKRSADCSQVGECVYEAEFLTYIRFNHPNAPTALPVFIRMWYKIESAI